MFEQRGEEGLDKTTAPERSEEGRSPEAVRLADGYLCYSLEVLLRLEDF